MRCPNCALLEDKVVDSRAADDGLSIRRRRECLACNHRFTTFERMEAQLPVVVKSSGVREPFDRSKIERGVRQAAKGRPVDEPQITEIAARIEGQVALLGAGEVSSQEIGLAVLDLLRDLDEITYLRFVSVYRGFENVEDFEQELGRLARRPMSGRPPLAP